MDSAQPQTTDQISQVKTVLSQARIPDDLKIRLTEQLVRLEKMIQTAGYRPEFDKDLEYIKFVVGLPFQSSSQDHLDLKAAAAILEKHHYGIQVVKDRILEYLSILILNARQGQAMHAPILAFVGLVGSGKTSLAYSIAEALGRQLIRIPFGGLGSVGQLRGESRIKAEAEPGLLMKHIRNCKVNNPIILLDEIDRVAVEARADLMGVLVELLDPSQNGTFVDHYVDYPFDLSKVMFIATANNTGNIATAVMDRIELVEMPAYSDEEKIVIGRDYILPKAIQDAGLPANVLQIDPAIWPQVVRPLGFDGGIRSLQRNIQTLARKVARKVVEGNPGPFPINASTIGEYFE